MVKNVKCNGQTVTKIVDNNGNTLANLSAEVENEAQYVIPSGTKSITANGTYSVSAFASASVDVQGGGGPYTPSISVGSNGIVTASGDGIVDTTHQLSSFDDADFVAGNIKSGVNLFGVTGTYGGGAGDVVKVNSNVTPSQNPDPTNGTYGTLEFTHETNQHGFYVGICTHHDTITRTAPASGMHPYRQVLAFLVADNGDATNDTEITSIYLPVLVSSNERWGMLKTNGIQTTISTSSGGSVKTISIKSVSNPQQFWGDPPSGQSWQASQYDIWFIPKMPTVEAEQ